MGWLSRLKEQTCKTVLQNAVLERGTVSNARKKRGIEIEVGEEVLII